MSQLDTFLYEIEKADAEGRESVGISTTLAVVLRAEIIELRRSRDDLERQIRHEFNVTENDE